MKCILIINVKMPTHVGILTFISMIHTSSESLKARQVFIFQHFSFHEQLKSMIHRLGLMCGSNTEHILVNIKGGSGITIII